MAAIPKPVPRAVEKRQRKRDEQANLRALWSMVDVRDKFKCRCCHVTLASMQRHRHHVRFRSAGGQDVLSNLLLLCAACHGLIHAHRLRIEGTDANQPVQFVEVQ